MAKKLMQLFTIGAWKRPTSAPMMFTTKTSFICSNTNTKSRRMLPRCSLNLFMHSMENNELTGKRGENEELIQVLQSEIYYEQSHREQYEETDKALLGSFSVDSDPPDSLDVVLRRSYDDEDIAITALLGPYEDGNAESESESESTEIYPHSVMMKVCITKAGVASILQFDCRLQGVGSDVILYRVSYHESPAFMHPSKYQGPTFSSLDYGLQNAFKEFLGARGISIDLANFLVAHLHNKEQHHYVQWLRYLDSMIKKGTKSG